MESRLGHDFSGVRAHTDVRANAAARAVHARAFTLGNQIVFASNAYQPSAESGRSLIAHELSHVVQQRDGVPPAMLQRQCDDTSFCTPYATDAEADAAEERFKTYLLPFLYAKFGEEVGTLWARYLYRSPGDSLERHVFETPGNPIEESFASSGAVEDDQEAILDLVERRLSRLPGGRLRPHTITLTSLANFLSPAEMDDRRINFSNLFTKAGNIAGDIGRSDAGPDTRRIARGNVELEKVPLVGDSGYIRLQLTSHYEVHDAIDFCPGQCGSPAEQVFTIPLSRLEAHGKAYDVPYVVRFSPPPETRREFYTSFPV